MEYWIQIIEKYSQGIMVVLSALGTLLLAWNRFKNCISNLYKKRKEYVESRNSIPETLKQIQGSVSNIDIRLGAVEKEMVPNGGGSMKDALKIIKAEIEATFWLNPKPSFRTTSKGLNIQVNEAYCHLCGTSTEELLRHGWKNYIDDGEELDYYNERWEEFTSSFSQFSGKLKFKNSRGEGMGEWLIKIRPLGSIDNGTDFLWHGTLYPYDEVAKEYAKHYNIPLG